MADGKLSTDPLTESERVFLARCAMLPQAARPLFLALAELPTANDDCEKTACACGEPQV